MLLTDYVWWMSKYFIFYEKSTFIIYEKTTNQQMD